MMIDRHKREHREMIVLADAILSLAGRAKSADIGEFTGLRLRFARLVKQHCDDEAGTIRTAISNHLLDAEVAAPFGRELMRWRADLAACNGRWPATAVIADPAGFTASFDAIVAALRSYVRREEACLLDAI